MSSRSLDLSVLKLASPCRRPLHSARFTFDTADLACDSRLPRGNPSWSGSSRLIEDDDVFGQHRAAIPFKWEEIPGTPRCIPRTDVKEEVSSSEQEDSSGISRSCSSSSTKSSGWSSGCSSIKTDSDFQFSPTETCPSTSKSTAELFSKGRVLPLKPPPRMQHVTQLLNLETTENRNCSVRSLTSLSNSTTAPRSFRRDGLKALPFLKSPRKEHNEDFMNTMLGFEGWGKIKNEQHRRSSSLSFSFRKKPVEEKDSDATFDEDFVGKGLLRERRTFSSISSRGLADGCNIKSKSWACDAYVEDSQLDVKSEYFDCTLVVPEEEVEKDQTKTDSESVLELMECQVEKKKTKKQLGLENLIRFLRSASSKPSRLSSISPAPLPLPPTKQTELKLRRVSKFQVQQGCSTNALIKMCFSNSLGKASRKERQPTSNF